MLIILYIKKNSIRLNLEGGQSQVRFVWVNAPEDDSYSVQIEKMFARNLYDVDGDGQVMSTTDDSKDIEYLESVSERLKQLGYCWRI